jgi:3-methyladenine DNA glycosylase/8-oxoguanine DNA glycosylase
VHAPDPTPPPRWAAAEAMLAADSRLGPIVRRVGSCRLAPEQPSSIFAALLRSIVYQQLHGRAAASIHTRVRALFPIPDNPAAVDLAAISDGALRAAGLSRGKLAAVRDLGARVQAGELPDVEQAVALPDEELVRQLTVVRGIGPWTVHMLQIFHLGRPDVWPTADFGVRSAVQKLWRKRRLPDDPFMERVARRWRPWRSVASWYLWRSHELRDE